MVRKNKILYLTILSMFFVVTLLAGCKFELGYNPDDDAGNIGVEEVFHQYCVFTEDTTFVDAELDKHYIATMPEVIDRSGKKVEGFELEIKSVEDSDGKSVIVSGGKIFIPRSIGEYTITFYCPEDKTVKPGSTKINCLDTTGPKIITNMINSFVFSQTGFEVPEFDATDKGGIDESSKTVKLFDSENNEVVPVNGRYEDITEGNYTYKFSVKDDSGNESFAEKPIYVTGQEMQEGKLTYLSANDFDLQTFQYLSESLPAMRWSENVKDPSGKETLQVVPAVDDTSAIKIGLSCAISDWSDYNYWSVYVYNPTSDYLACGLIGGGDTNSYMLTPNSWTYVCRPVEDYLVDNNAATHLRNEYSRVVLHIYDRWTKDGQENISALNTTDVFYVSNIYLSKDETDNVFSLGEKYGMKNLAMHQKYMDYSYEATSEYTFDGDEYSSKFTFSEATIHSFNVSFSYATSKFNKTNPRYLVSVYNPNDYDIIIIDNSCDNMTARGENCSENFSTIVKAGETARVLFRCNVDERYAYLMALKTDGSYVDSDFVIYFGNVRASDNYTGDDSLWNETYGDVDIWTKYLAKIGG